MFHISSLDAFAKPYTLSEVFSEGETKRFQVSFPEPNRQIVVEIQTYRSTLTRIIAFNDTEIETYRWVNPAFFDELYEQDTAANSEGDDAGVKYSSWLIGRFRAGNLFYIYTVVDELSDIIWITNNMITETPFSYDKPISVESFMRNYLPNGAMATMEQYGANTGSES